MNKKNSNSRNKFINPIKVFNGVLILIVLVFVIISGYLLANSSDSPTISVAAAETEMLAEDSPTETPTIQYPVDTQVQVEVLPTATSIYDVKPTVDFLGNLVSVYPMILNEEYIPNPGMGWVFRWGDVGIPDFETSLAYSQRNQISWQVLNPSEGEYDWTMLDRQIDLAVEQGKQYSFRVYTMIGEDYGGHQVPVWVLSKGAVILPSGEPDYSNCVYQEEWTNFVEALLTRYDGNSDIAFIDISGYGNFNEWNWSDAQTEWDDAWQESYEAGIIIPASFRSLDGQARRRLVDIFIGGSNASHQCKNADSSISTVSYEYSGFQKTQLVMPFAGIIQSTQYVFSRNPAIGFRHDCLGRSSSNNIPDILEAELKGIWRNAPVVFETCSYSDFGIGSAYYLLENTHASVLHNVNIDDLSVSDVYGLSELLGYKYYLAKIEHSAQSNQGRQFFVRMVWQNIGQAPSYPRMGQDFELALYMVNKATDETFSVIIPANVNEWMPLEFGEESRPEYLIEQTISLPDGLQAGDYDVKVAILDSLTGEPINLAMLGQGEDGLYTVSELEIKNP